MRNIRFNSPEGWEVAYADVCAVRNFTICEILFTGRLEDCLRFIDDNHHKHTAAPTCPVMAFRSKSSRELPQPHGSLSSSITPVNREFKWGESAISGNAPTENDTILDPSINGTPVGAVTHIVKTKKKFK
jgi:hypothetical protein